jgi:hypothetical protein
VINMNHILEDSGFKYDSEGDGQPVQLYECWCDVVARTKTRNKPCRSVTSGQPVSFHPIVFLPMTDDDMGLILSVCKS